MSKRKKSGKRRTHNTLTDITINDFANSSVCKNRPKKSIDSVTTVLKKLELNEKSWDEKTEDFEGDFVEQQNEDGTISYVIQKVEPRRRKKTTSSSESPDNATTITGGGNQYPIDIWFLISEYIRPEDVGRFAGICRYSYEVVCTAKFWYSLYKRYYKTQPHLPERLQPECMFRKYGLRTSVVRALHYTYNPFVNRLKSLEKTEQHPDVLRKMKCTLMWHQKSKNQCLYFFKMTKVNHARTSARFSHSETSRKPDLLEMLDDVYANQDENCRVLQITCKHLIPVAPVLGLTLTSAHLTLSAELRYHKLQLWFGSEFKSYAAAPSVRSANNCDDTLIVLEPVINVKVLDWWHPLYPHIHNMEHLFNQD